MRISGSLPNSSGGGGTVAGTSGGKMGGELTGDLGSAVGAGQVGCIRGTCRFGSIIMGSNQRTEAKQCTSETFSSRQCDRDKGIRRATLGLLRREAAE